MLLHHYRITFLNSLFVLFIAAGLAGCSEESISDLLGDNEVRLLVANEGNFSDGSGSITSFDSETGSVVQQQFEQVNGRPLAGIIQSVSRSGDRLYIVTNSTNKVEVTHPESLESIATIPFDDISPVGFAEASGQKGYVSTLFDNSVLVVDLENHERTGTRIEVGNNPQQMVIVGDQLYVANSGFGYDQSVTVIDTSSDEVVTTLTVGAGPTRMEVDSENRIWVVANGRMAYDEEYNRDPENDVPGRIDVLNGDSSELIGSVETGGFPRAIALDENEARAWVVNDQAVQTIDMNTLSVTNESFIGRSFNGIGFSASENRIYLAHSRGYEQSGQAVIYNTEGAAVDSFSVGIAPMDFLFMEATGD